MTHALLERREGAPWLRTGAVALLLVLVPMGWGVWRAATLETRPTARVAVVQPNIPEHIKLDASRAMDSTWNSLDRLMPRIEPGSVDLVVWPEVTFPVYLEEWPSQVERIAAIAASVRAPIVVGAYRRDFTGADRENQVTFNSAFVVDSTGLRPYAYDKRYLVPVVERVPFLNPAWFGELRYFGGLGKGRDWPLAEADGGAFGVLICYESSFPPASRRFRLEGADFLVNITNDAWYGREPWYSRTIALWQHPAHMVMRAIEHRVGVARSANTGITLFVDPVGRMEEETDLFEATLRVATVHTTDVTTLYTRVGDVAGSGAALATVLLLLLAWRRGREEEERQGESGGAEGA